MTMNEKYVEVLKTFSDFVTIREWAERFTEMYQDDFKRIDENAQNQTTEKNQTNGLRELCKRIRQNLKTNEDWSGLIAAYENSLPLQVKYVGNLGVSNMSEFMKNLYYPLDDKKDFVSASFDIIMDELEYFDLEEDNLPKRDDPKYISNAETTGIEQIDAFEYSSCIMLEMAHRNEDVIDTIDKIEYIQSLMREPIVKLRTEMYKSFKNSLIKSKNKSNENIQEETPDLIIQINESIERTKLLLGNVEINKPTKDDLLNNPTIKPDDEKSIQMMTTDYFSSKSSCLQHEYKYIIKLPMGSFKKELEFFEDNSTAIRFFKDNDITDKNTQYLYKLSAIMELLQNKLDSNFFIYPKKYYKGISEPCSYKVKCKNFIRGNVVIQKIMKRLNDSYIQESLQKFKELKQFKDKKYTLEDIADLFFMYDYYKARLDIQKPEITLNSISKELKLALTIFYGVKNKKTGELISYDDRFLEKYNDFDGEVSFYSTARHIRDKIKLMQYFIERQHFRFIIFS
jgi:hypothetical protein